MSAYISACGTYRYSLTRDVAPLIWGVHAPPEATAPVLELIGAPHCLGVTKHGAPRHPLYVRADTRPVPFAHCPPVASGPPQ